MFGAVNLTSNADPDKYKYSGYGNGFDACGSFSLWDGSALGQNVIIFGELIGACWWEREKGPIYGLDDATWLQRHKEIYLSLHYDWMNSYIFLIDVKYINLKQEILK